MISQRAKDYASTKGAEFPCRPACRKEKRINYYSKTKYGLDYTSSNPEINVLQEGSSKSTPAQSSSTSSHNSDYGLKRLFRRMLVNMVFASTNFDRERSDHEDPLKFGHREWMHIGNSSLSTMNLP